MTQTIIDFLNINTVFITILDYPLSYLELSGTIFNLICVWLAARNKVLNWPIGLVGVILFGFLFYQIQLYSDLLEQVYYFITGIYGWLVWTSMNKLPKAKETTISTNSWVTNRNWLISIVIGSLALGWLTARLDVFFPAYFTVPASFPYLDATTTVLSFAAQLLLVRRKIESWYLWILVDIVAIGLYWTKGVVFVFLLYAIFLVLATKGLLDWKREFRLKQQEAR